MKKEDDISLEEQNKYLKETIGLLDEDLTIKVSENIFLRKVNKELRKKYSKKTNGGKK